MSCKIFVTPWIQIRPIKRDILINLIYAILYKEEAKYFMLKYWLTLIDPVSLSTWHRDQHLLHEFFFGSQLLKKKKKKHFYIDNMCKIIVLQNLSLKYSGYELNVKVVSCIKSYRTLRVNYIILFLVAVQRWQNNENVAFIRMSASINN